MGGHAGMVRLGHVDWRAAYRLEDGGNLKSGGRDSAGWVWDAIAKFGVEESLTRTVVEQGYGEHGCLSSFRQASVDVGLRVLTWRISMLVSCILLR